MHQCQVIFKASRGHVGAIADNQIDVCEGNATNGQPTNATTTAGGFGGAVGDADLGGRDRQYEQPLPP